MKCAQLVGAITNGGRRKNYDEAISRFNHAAEELRELDYDFVYNPIDYQVDGKQYEEYIYETLDSIITDRPDIYLLKGWQESLGARIEVEFAKRMGLRVTEL
jgi:hypothetical protein